MPKGPIVVGVDGIEPSLDALRFARDAARRERAEDGLDLVVVHVRRSPWTGWTAEAAAPVLEAVDDIERDAEAAVRGVLSGDFITWRWVVAQGDPAREIIRVANDVGARAIAVGGHRHGAFTSALVRSVDAGLVHAYEGTLLIVRPGPGGSSGGSGAGFVEASATTPAPAGATAPTGGSGAAVGAGAAPRGGVVC